jgi:hypothetical protein
MTPDYRALAQSKPKEVVIPDQYKGHQVHVYRAGFHAGYKHGLTQAAVALAQPNPVLPPSYIDAEHTGQDQELLKVFYKACLLEGGTADEIHLRGLKAVLARWGTPANTINQED